MVKVVARQEHALGIQMIRWEIWMIKQLDNIIFNLSQKKKKKKNNNICTMVTPFITYS